MNAQINLRLPEALLLKTKKYAQKQGFGNVQEFIKETIREKVFGEPEITPEGFELIKKLIEVSNKKNLWKTEEELFTMLRERRNGTHNKRK